MKRSTLIALAFIVASASPALAEGRIVVTNPNTVPPTTGPTIPTDPCAPRDPNCKPEPTGPQTPVPMRSIIAKSVGKPATLNVIIRK